MTQIERNEPNDTSLGLDGDIQVAEIIGNLGNEMAQALKVCVNVEEIIADRLLAGGVEGNFARVELQNIDRLIQMLTDFQSLAANLAEQIQPQHVDLKNLRADLVVDELARRLFLTS